MKAFEDAWHRDDLPSGAVGTIGNYDGVHRGQRSILNKVVERSRALGIQSAVVTFDPHPAKVLAPEWAPRCLTTKDQKVELLAGCGIDLAFFIDFDAEFAQVPARLFVERFLYGRLNLREIYVGSRFVFGHGREGDLALLQSLGSSPDSDTQRAFGIAELDADGAPISSTRVREAVATGDVRAAARLLGRSYELTGVVIRGAGQGRKLGWPTINLQTENELLPAHGVYVTRVLITDADGGAKARASVANVGVRPTLHAESAPTVECHLLDFSGDLYGRSVRLEFLERLRGEQVFASAEALRLQIDADVTAARAYFAGEPLEAPVADR